MANEVQFSFITSKTCYVLIRDRTGNVWNTNSSAFEAYTTANFNLSRYNISAIEQGSASAFFTATFPSAIVAGIYFITAKQQIGGSVAETDPTVAVGTFQWNGSANFPLSDVTVSGSLGVLGPTKLARGVQILNFMFKLVSQSDHVTPFTSGVISGQISKDGGAFGALQSGAFSEVGLGFYSLQALTSGDMSANTIALSFSANGISGGASDRRDFSLVTQRVSGFLSGG